MLSHPATLLFDGHCSICRWFVGWIKALDWLHIFRFADCNSEHIRLLYAPDKTTDELLHALHVRYSDGRYMVGFFAVRFIALRVPLLFFCGVLMYLPGIPWLGVQLYSMVAQRRCRDGACRV